MFVLCLRFNAFFVYFEWQAHPLLVNFPCLLILVSDLGDMVSSPKGSSFQLIGVVCLWRLVELFERNFDLAKSQSIVGID